MRSHPHPRLRVPSVLGCLALIAGALWPAGVNAATTYQVSRAPHEGYSPLPIEGGGPVVVPEWSQKIGSVVSHDEGKGSAWFALPFPVRFFGRSYEGVAAKDGVLYFGSREETLCDEAGSTFPSGPACASQASMWRNPGPIPRELVYPNRLLALWWGIEGSCQIRGQTLGEAPARVQVIQFSCSDSIWEGGDQLQMQARFFEGSSAIEVRYRRGPGSLVGTHLPYFVGIMSPEGDGVSGVAGLPCSRPGSSCTWSDYPDGFAITYSLPPDLAVTSIATAEHVTPGVALQASVRVENIGDQPVTGVSTRFYLSEKETLDASAIPLPESLPFDLGPGQSIEHERTFSLPPDLGAGLYRILAQVDPHGVVEGEVNLANNLGASAPFLYGPGIPFLNVRSVDAEHLEVAPGDVLELEFSVSNEGTAAAEEIRFAVVLSRDEALGPSDHLVTMGEFTVDAFDEARIFHDVEIPSEIGVGQWFLGLLLDPAGALPRTAIGAGQGIAGRLLIAQSSVWALTRTLPQAQIGQSYCVVLEAGGGAGVYRWSVPEGSTLPAGLMLEELPAGAREEGLPFVTRLCGRPSRLGTSRFELEIQAEVGGATLTAAQDYLLEVVAEPLPLSIASAELPAGAYREEFFVRLAAHGGTPPYGWTLEAGTLPQGLHLGSEGVIAGIPMEDGRFLLTVSVHDAGGQRVIRDLALLIIAPTRLRCHPQELPALGIGEQLDVELRAAGGSRPYLWQTIETRRLAGLPGETATSSPGEAPPGLSLSSLGEVSGAPSRNGRYLWTVEVSDSAQIPARDECMLVVDVAVDRELSVINRNLAPAVVGEHYEVQLSALGGEGTLRWSLFEGYRLPEGMSLSPSGLLQGTPTRAVLEGEREWTFSFLIEVRDEGLRRGLAPLSLTVLGEAPQPMTPPAADVASGGCGAAGGSTSWLALVLGASFLAIRRQARNLLLAGLMVVGLVACDGQGSKGSKTETCGGQVCGQGTSCNEASGRCECSRAPDSCAPHGKVCNSVGVCIDREEPKVTEPFVSCPVPGESNSEGTMICHGPLEDGASYWAPLCERSEECVDPTTVCLNERTGGELPICWFNFCGESELIRDREGLPVPGEDGAPQLLNGESWGPCDSVTGRLEAGGPGTGTCLPEEGVSSPRFLCHASGRLELGASCLADAGRSETDLCEQGLGCRGEQPTARSCWEDWDCEEPYWCNHPGCDRTRPDCMPEFCKPRPCSSREECGSGNFCVAGACVKGGSCEGLCDGLAEATGAFASCERERMPAGFECIGGVPPDTSNLASLVAYCEEGACDALDPSSCGDEARCEPKPNPQHPTGGACVPYGKRIPVGEGHFCGEPYICTSGLSCKRVYSEDGPDQTRCVQLCTCEDGEGWDETARCRTPAAQCGEGQRCTQLLLGNDVLGACL